MNALIAAGFNALAIHTPHKMITNYILDFSLGWEGKAYFENRSDLEAAIKRLKDSDYIGAIQSAASLQDLMDIGWSAKADDIEISGDHL